MENETASITAFFSRELICFCARAVIRDYIGALYGIERHIKTLRERREQAGQVFSLDEVLKIRQEKSVPIAAAFKKWLDEIGPGVTPTSALGKAIAYSISQWPKLICYLDHPEMPPDNNRVEQAIRPFAVEGPHGCSVIPKAVRGQVRICTR